MAQRHAPPARSMLHDSKGMVAPFIVGILVAISLAIPLTLALHNLGIGFLIGAAFGTGIGGAHAKRQMLLAHKQEEKEYLFRILLIFLIGIAVLIFLAGIYFAWCDCF